MKLWPRYFLRFFNDGFIANVNFINQYFSKIITEFEASAIVDETYLQEWGADDFGIQLVFLEKFPYLLQGFNDDAFESVRHHDMDQP